MSTSLNKSIIATISGNIMEFYNFIIYIYFSSYIAANFFPAESGFISQLLTLCVFTSSYVIRPIGALMMGYIGDKLGRKRSLILSISLMTLATVTIGLLPTYQAIGICAPLLVLLCRLIQGFAVSGEESGAAIYLCELLPQNQHARLSALIFSSVSVGILLGACVCFTLNIYLSPEELTQWGWRIPFYLSIPLGVISYYTRKLDNNHKVDDQLIKYNKNQNPIATLFRYYYKEIVYGTLLVSCTMAPMYIFNVFLPLLFNNTDSITDINSFLLTNSAILMLIVLLPITGKIADHIGHLRMFMIGILLFILCSYSIFTTINNQNLTSSLYAFAAYALCLACLAAPLFALIVRLFPANIRFTGVAFVFNLGICILGSTAPLVGLLLHEKYNSLTAIGLYLSIICIVTGLIILTGKSKLQQPLKTS